MELEFIRWLRQQFDTDSRMLGDDAAILDWSGNPNCVAATDLLADGVHFELAKVGAKLAGRKALAVNLSDLAAMAARPIAAFVSLLLPRRQADSIAREVMLGIQPLAKQFQVMIAGGDTNVWDGRLVVNVAVLGTTDQRPPWTRQGMKPGDWLMATGPFGGSSRGHHLTFIPRVHEALKLADQYDIHAAIDVSDGLSLDASRLAEASGCGVVLERSAIPISSAARQAPVNGIDSDRDRSPLEHALYDGEDFELLLAIEERQARQALERSDSMPDLQLTVIGYATSQTGLWLTDDHGKPLPIAPRGYEHGAKQ